MNRATALQADMHVALQEYRNTLLQQAPRSAWRPSEGFICSFAQRVQYTSSLYIQTTGIVEHNRFKTYPLLMTTLLDLSIRSLLFSVPFRIGDATTSNKLRNYRKVQCHTWEEVPSGLSTQRGRDREDISWSKIGRRWQQATRF